ncbi:hypothetical protein [Ruegeria conchae]|uniref:Dolichyl-phosphate-mannose-protein mannosyltransferase n=1 Tax=Ruegeria conchae TaxID=981384 RepID=A0A497ZWE7_9RHOB|nr:hypothetical protein [Ruegeria conchae]RLK07327.1 hypothetical protein CLV75_2448 [Ruegeria conchae]
MQRDIGHPNGPFGLLILALVSVFGTVQIYFWTDRSIWIDEVSQLLNFPLTNLAQAFGPLPEAQQAGPPVFNLLLQAISGLSIHVMRLIIILLTLCVISAAMFGAFGKRALPMAAGLLVLLSLPSFLINGSMLKFYAFDAAGFAIFAAWIYAKDRSAGLNFRDIAVLLAGLFLGVSTIVGACVVVGVFLVLRLLGRQLEVKEIALAGLLIVLSLAYYLQIGHATKIQITAFPDAYGGLGMEALQRFGDATMELFRIRGAAILFVVCLVALAAVAFTKGAERSQLSGLILFISAILAVFLGLAAIGKYPAASSRHLVWMLGVFPVLAGAVVDCLLRSLSYRRSIAIAGLAVLSCIFAATGLRVVSKWPPQLVEGSSDQVIATLADLPPSQVLHYFGAFRLIPLMIERGAPISHHSYAPSLSTHSVAIDPSYFDPEWNEMDADLFSELIEDMLHNDPAGWAKMYIMLRLRGDFRPLARFVLDAAPRDGSTFYISSIHAVWPGDTGRATHGLRQVLDEKSCDYEPVGVFITLLSPGYVLKVNCPKLP